MVVRVLRHYFPLSLVALGFAEALIFFGAMYLGVAVRFAGADLSPEAASAIFPIFSKACVFALVMLGSLLAFGLYQRENQQNELDYIVRLMIGFLTGLLIMMIIFYAAPALALGRGAFGLTVLFAFTGVLTARAVFLRLADRGAFRRRILVLAEVSPVGR